MHVFKKWSHKKEVRLCINLKNLDGMLPFIGLQRVRHHLGTEQQQRTSTHHLELKIFSSAQKNPSLSLSLSLLHTHTFIRAVYKCLVIYKYLLMHCTTVLKVPRASMAGTETKTK